MVRKRRKTKISVSCDDIGEGSGSQESASDRRGDTQQPPFVQQGGAQHPPSSESISRPSQVALTEQIQQLSLQTNVIELATSQDIVPASSKSMRLPLRPEKGSYGFSCVVKSNHFFVELSKKDIHQYDVSITPKVTSCRINRAIMKELINNFKESHLGGLFPIYDGIKNIYTAGPLPFTSNEFQVTLVDEKDDCRTERLQRNFKIIIKLAACNDFHHLEMLLSAKQTDVPQEALRALNTVLREFPTSRFLPVGRSFYFIEQNQTLGGGLENLRGYFQSIKPSQIGLLLNIDVLSAPFIEPSPVIDLLKFLNWDFHDVQSRPLSDSECFEIMEALRGVKVEVTHQGNMRRKYRIAGLTSQPTKELTFPVDERGTMKTVVQYFRETYGFTIQYTNWPCLQVDNQQKPIYLPMEVCKIVRGQKYAGNLNQRQITAFEMGCLSPQNREKQIKKVHCDASKQDPHPMEFGIKISDTLTSVEARVLPPPWLKYHDTGR